MLEGHGWQVRHALDFSTDTGRLPRLHRGLARRVHGRQGPERAPAHRLVQRPQRHLPGRRAAGDHPGHRLQQRVPDGRGAVRVLDHGRDPGRGRGDQLRLRAPLAAPPRRSRASTSRTTSCSAACSRTSAWSSASGRGYPVQQPRHRSVPAGSRPHAGLAPAHPPAAARRWRPIAAPRPCRSATCIPGRCPPASIVIVTHDNLLFTRMCLESVLACTEYPGLRADRGRQRLARRHARRTCSELAAAQPARAPGAEPRATPASRGPATRAWRSRAATCSCC